MTTNHTDPFEKMLDKAEADNERLRRALFDLLQFVGRTLPHQRWIDDPVMERAREALG